MHRSNAQNIISTSENETLKIGESLLSLFPNTSLFLLNGNLGSGKTVLTKGIVGGLGVESHVVKSPTYAFYNVYEANNNIYHFDLYKLTPNKQHHDILLEIDEILDQENSIVIIEWANRLPRLNTPHLNIDITFEGESSRLIQINKND
ncbi:tRNA (adenosine(37)-N6)-threonylcarbamoyltransferase complex ATPase subunit type 1 TsaE [Patescibacteria group bacterium]|nr:tRNA (adenosine(37)-N6)-threonylcarbamoyltransferase complex ATPase subunit type 1 TsaE [Patescibacteria group bacterium]